MPNGFLDLLPRIAGHPVAIAAYICVLAGWLVWMLRRIKSQDFLRTLAKIPKDERATFCRQSGFKYEELAQIPDKDKLKLLTRRYVLLAVIASVIALFLLGLTWLLVSQKIQRDGIVPRVQVVPSELAVDRPYTTLTVDVGNYGEFIARNVRVDVKFGTNQWHREVSKAERKDSLRQFQLTEREKKQLEEGVKNLADLPQFVELKPERTGKITYMDSNKDFFRDWQYRWHEANGKDVPIPFEQTSIYGLSQGWKEAILDSNPKEPITILIRARWENQIRRKFERVTSYRLNVSSYGTEHVFAFIPEAIVVEDF